MIRAAFAVSLSLAASTGVAGVNELTPLGPEGGHIIDVEFHRATPGLVYLIAPPGFFRSTDGGSSWQLTKPDPGNFEAGGEIAVDPSDSQRVYVAAGDEILVSNDGGLTFSSSLLPNRQGFVIRIECGPDGTVYAPDGAKMYRSQDRGQTWQQVGAFPQTFDWAHALAVDPTVTSQQLECSIERLTASSTATVTLTASGNAQFSVQAAATATEADLDTSNNSVAAQVVISVAPPPSSGGGGGGGGGAISLLTLIALAALAKLLQFRRTMC
jgi:hypothetical protein